MAKFTTQWHRFNTVVESPAAPLGEGAVNLTGTSEGIAGLAYTDNILLSDPNIIDSSGTQLEFSEEIPSGAVITGIQYQYYASSSINSTSQIMYVYPKISSPSTTGTLKQIPGSNAYEGNLITQETSITDNDLGLGTDLNLSNVDNIQIDFDYVVRIGINDYLFWIRGYDFEDANGPSPAVRLEYELRPKVTIATGGKLSITQGKMHIV